MRAQNTSLPAQPRHLTATGVGTVSTEYSLAQHGDFRFGNYPQSLVGILRRGSPCFGRKRLAC